MSLPNHQSVHHDREHDDVEGQRAAQGLAATAAAVDVPWIQSQSASHHRSQLALPRHLAIEILNQPVVGKSSGTAAPRCWIFPASAEVTESAVSSEHPPHSSSTASLLPFNFRPAAAIAVGSPCQQGRNGPKPVDDPQRSDRTTPVVIGLLTHRYRLQDPRRPTAVSKSTGTGDHGQETEVFRAVACLGAQRCPVHDGCFFLQGEAH